MRKKCIFIYEGKRKLCGVKSLPARLIPSRDRHQFESSSAQMFPLNGGEMGSKSYPTPAVWDDGTSISSHDEEEEAFRFTRSQSYKIRNRNLQTFQHRENFSEANEKTSSHIQQDEQNTHDNITNEKTAQKRVEKTRFYHRRKSASFSEFGVLDTLSEINDRSHDNNNNNNNKDCHCSTNNSNRFRSSSEDYVKSLNNTTSLDEGFKKSGRSQRRRHLGVPTSSSYISGFEIGATSSQESLYDLPEGCMLFKRNESWRIPFVAHHNKMLKLRKQQAEHNNEKVPDIKTPEICTECENLRSGHDVDRREELQEREHGHYLTIPRISPRLAPDRLEGETEEDAEIRKRAVQSRTRSRGSATVVQIPTASIQMDLHTIYLESITPKTVKKGKTMDDTKQKRLQRSSHVYSILDDDNEKKAGRFAQLRQRFKREENSSLDEFQNFMQHLQSNLVEVSDHNLAIYMDCHWSTISRFNENHNGVEEEMLEAANISNQERDRYEALWELFYAEVSYLIDHLLVLQNVFVKPLEHAKSYSYLQMIDENIIFANLDRLIEVISQFAEKLLNIFKNCRVSVSKSTEIIVEAFKEFDDVLTPQYNEYCLNYQAAKTYITDLKEDELFMEFIKWCEQDDRCQRRKLEDFLVAPLQHLVKYPLLLKAIRKRTPKNDINNQFLTTTIFDIEQSIKSIEKKISSLVNTKRIQEIMECVHWPIMPELDQKSIIPDFVRAELNNSPCDTTLMNPNRQLLQEGYLTLAEPQFAKTFLDNNKSEFYLFLFDDMLLVTKSKKMKRRNTADDMKLLTEQTLKKKQTTREPVPHNLYTVHKQPIPLDRLKLYNCEDQTTAFKNAFCVIHYNRYHQAVSVYTFQAPTAGEKKIWLRSIKKAQDDVITEAYSSSTKDISSDEEYMM